MRSTLVSLVSLSLLLCATTACRSDRQVATCTLTTVTSRGITVWSAEDGRPPLLSEFPHAISVSESGRVVQNFHGAIEQTTKGTIRKGAITGTPLLVDESPFDAGQRLRLRVERKDPPVTLDATYRCAVAEK